MSFLHLFKEKSLIGIDITHNQVCLVEMTKGKTGLQMLGYSQTIIEEAEDQSSSHLCMELALKKALMELQQPGRQVAIAVDHSATIFKTLALDASLRATEIMALVRKQVSEYFNLEQSELLLDFTVLGAAKTPGLVDVRWVATKRWEVATQINLLTKLGFMVSQVEVSSFALQRTLGYFFQQLDVAKPTELIALAYIRSDALFLGIFDRNKSVYVLAEHHHFLANVDPHPVISQFIQRGLQTYLSTHNPRRIDGIFLAGLSATELLVDLVQTQCQISTYSSDPLAWFGNTNTHSSQFLLSIGLAMNIQR